MSDPDISAEIKSAALANTKRIVGDELTVDERSIEELIMADEYVSSVEAITKKKLPIRIGRFKAPGANT